MPYHSKSAKQYPHQMYKGNMVKTAKTEAEHKKLMKMGYSHTKPKK